MQNQNIKENTHHGYLTLVAWISCMGAVCFGFNTAVVNGALDFMAKPSQLNLTPWAQGVVSSGLTLGAAFGAVFGAPLSDKLGRKKTMIWLGVIFTIFGLGCGLAPSTSWLIIFRFIMGLAVGAVSALVPVYLAEISPAAERGKYVSMNQLMIVGGQFLVFAINAILGNVYGAHDAAIWRVMLGLAAVPGVLLWLGMYAAPESPTWYANHGMFGQALASLQRIRSKAQAEAELIDLKNNVKKEQQENSEKASWKNFKKNWIIQIVITGAMLGVFQQFAGINSVMYYGTKILTSSGFGANTALYLNIANGIFSIVGAIVGMFTVDRLGRKPLLLIGYIFCAIALISVALVGTFALNTAWAPYFVLVVLLVYIVIDQGTLGPVTWLLNSEIFPNRYRGLGTGITIFVLWFANFIVGLVFPQLLATIGLYSFYIFAACCLLGAWFVIVRVPETKGVPLSEIEKFFRSRYDK